MKKTYLHAAYLSLLLMCSSLNAMAEVVLVVATGSPLESLSRHDIEDIFLGKTTTLPKIGKITPLDRNDEKLREQFYTTYTGKSLSQVKSHWARIIFTGRGYPPKTVGLEELKAALRNSSNAIGYMTPDQVDGTIKVLKLNP